MWYMVLKAALSGLLVLAISEIAKRSPAFGALVASLPLVSLLAIMWLWRETGDTIKIADHAEATFWYVLPSLPMFLILPRLLRSGTDFWIALGLSVATTVTLYLLMIFAAEKMGFKL